MSIIEIYCSIFDYFLKTLLKFFVDLTIKFTITGYRPKFAENCCAHKVSISVLLIIATFLLSSLLSLKTGCFSLIFSVCQTMYITSTSGQTRP